MFFAGGGEYRDGVRNAVRMALGHNTFGESPRGVDIGNSIIQRSKGGPSKMFFEKYGWLIGLGNQPSDSTLGILLNLHKRRSAEFAPLSRVANALGNKEYRVEPTRIKGTPLMLDDNTISLKRNSDFNRTAETFIHAVRTLMYGYALVSAADATGHERCDLNATMAHITAVGYYSRLNSKRNNTPHSRLIEIEMAIRTEWRMVFQQDRRFSIGEAVAFTGQRKLRPFISEFRPVKGGGKRLLVTRDCGVFRVGKLGCFHRVIDRRAESVSLARM